MFQTLYNWCVSHPFVVLVCVGAAIWCLVVSNAKGDAEVSFGCGGDSGGDCGGD